MFCFLNELDFIEQINSDSFEKLRCVKQRIIIDIDDYIVSKLIYIFYIVDDMNISVITIEQKTFCKKNSLRETILYLISFKHFVGSV